MTAATFTPNFAANEHIYLLPHVTKDIFQIRTCSTIENRAKLLDPRLYNLDYANVLQFEGFPYGPGSSKAVAILRKLAAPYKAPESSREGFWYQGSGRLEVLRSFLHQVEAAAYVSVRELVPKDPIERADQEDDEREFLQLREKRRLEEAYAQRQLLEAEREAEAAAKREKAAQAERAAVALTIENNVYLAPTYQPEALLSNITRLFREINQRCGGFCELKLASPEALHLNFYVRRADEPAVAEAIAALQGMLLLSRDPKILGDGPCTYSRPFCREAHTPIRSKTKGVTHKSMTIRTPQSWFRALLLSLKPGIRGWDLPIDAAVLSYDPNPERVGGLGRATPPESCAVRDIWAMGTSCAAPEVISYLKGFGLSLGWEPGNLRFVAESPLLEDEGSPLLLLRLVRENVGVGIQKIRLDTGGRETLAFANCEVKNAVGALWKPKKHVFVATSLEDAMAMNARAKKPCLVAPSPQALAQLEWPEGTTTITAFLPAIDSAPWIAAVAALRARENPEKVWVAQMFPHERSSCPGFLFPAEWAWQCKQQTRGSR